MLSRYPSAPTNIAHNALEPSADFKKQVVNVLFAIASFFAVYLLLVLAAIGLAIACLFGAGAVLVLHPSFLTLSLAIGLLALGVSVIVFLVKFIFSVSKNENDARVEISEAEQPELFAFIRQLTIDTKTQFPKRIFLSPEVNACVFYNSSFWSMILPIRKNLEIGVGLVNCLNISEFKAVMAHEFGHFSQQSMKLGSFTYNVNKIIYNMLFDNTGYTNFLNAWAKAGSVISIFAVITANIAEGIQHVLKEMYKVVNKSYMRLSREMEFHADAVAASVAGGNNLVTALARIQVGSGCYSAVLEKANEWLREKKRTDNVFTNQLSVLKQVANDHQLTLTNGIPVVTAQFIENFSKSRINYKDQWASHPSFSDRKAHVEALNMSVVADDTSAWLLFANAASVQQQMTAKIYASASVKEDETTLVEEVAIENDFAAERAKRALPEIYKGYYDYRFIEVDDWKMGDLKETLVTLDFTDIFNEENAAMQGNIDALKKDIATLTAIGDKSIDVTSFDFDGVKYEVSETDTVKATLQAELDTLTAKQSTLDKAAFAFFYHLPNNASVEFVYSDFIKHTIHCNVFNHLYEQIYKTVSPLYQGGNSLEFITSAVATLTSQYEPKLKTNIREVVDSLEMNEEQSKRMNAFLNSRFTYFDQPNFRSEQFEELEIVVKTMANLLYEKKFSLYKHLLTEQLKGIAA